MAGVAIAAALVPPLAAARLDRAVQAALADQFAALLPGSELVEMKQASSAGGTLQLAVTVRSSEQYPYATALAFQREVATRIQHPVALLLNVIQATQLDPLVPPTSTPTPTPTATATAEPVPAMLAPGRGATATLTPVPSPSPTPLGDGTPVILLGERVEATATSFWWTATC